MRAVVFDVGNVLYYWDPRALYRQLIADDAALDHFLATVVTEEWHFQHDAGRPFAETSAELIQQFPDHRALIAAWAPRFDETITGPVAGMLELVDELARSNVPLFAITNFSAEFWPPFRARRASVFDQFRDVVVSGDERVAKPDPRIYQLALRRFGLTANDALFLDDKQANVDAACENGFIGHHFTSVERARAALIAHGVLAA